MSTPEPRISVKKKQAIKYGRKVARLHIGPSREIFTVHEDLICSKSSFFRRKLQPKRQDISGDCSICQEEMRVEGQDLTFCSTSCGGNFHYGCIEKWEERQGRVESGPNCPLCRKAWPAPTMSIVVYRIPLGSPRFVVGVYAVAADPTWFLDHGREVYPKEFMRDLLVAKFRKQPGDNEWSLNELKNRLCAENDGEVKDEDVEEEVGEDDAVL